MKMTSDCFEIKKIIKIFLCVVLALLFIYPVEAEVIKPDQNSFEYQTQSARLNIIWNDYSNSGNLRPQSIICILKDVSSNKDYRIRLYENDVKFINNNSEVSSIDGMSISKGKGKWTLVVDNMSNHDYKLVLDSANSGTLNNNYTSKQSGTTITNTLKNYNYMSEEAKNAAWLSTRDSRLYDNSGNLVILKGVVTPNAGTNQLGFAVAPTSLKALKDLGVNSIRVTVQLKSSSSSATDGYLFDNNGNRITNNQEGIKTAIDNAISNASALGIYTIVDWGILNQNPMQYKEDAKTFFSYLANKYKNNPYVLYEICNEPNSETNGWTNNIKPYSEEIISAIRGQESNGVIIVAPKASATAISSADNDDPISAPIAEDKNSNVAYSFHAYPYNYAYNDAGKNNTTGIPVYSWKLRDAVANGLTIIATETGTLNATLTNGDETKYDNDEMNKYAYFFAMNDTSFNYFRYSFGWESSSYSEWTILKRINSDYYNSSGEELYLKHLSNLNLENDFSKNYVTKTNDDSCKGKGVYTNSGYWFYNYMTNNAFYKLPNYKTVQKKYQTNVDEEKCESEENNNSNYSNSKFQVPSTGKFISKVILISGILLICISLIVMAFVTKKRNNK